MRKQAGLLAVLWLAVAVAGSALVWVGIGSAGQDVSRVLEVPPPATTAAAPAQVRVTGGGTLTPRPTPSAPVLPPTSSAVPAPDPSAPPPAAPPTSAPPPAPAAPVARSGTWQGSAGVVRATCRGSAIGLDGAFPSAGWSFEVDGRGPDRVEVEFHQEREEGREVKVRATCSAGAPRFEISSEGAESEREREEE